MILTKDISMLFFGSRLVLKHGRDDPQVKKTMSPTLLGKTNSALLYVYLMSALFSNCVGLNIDLTNFIILNAATNAAALTSYADRYMLHKKD